MFAVGLPDAPETATSVRAYGRQTSQPPAAWAAAALSAVRPLRVRISLALTPALRSFLTCALVATISTPLRRCPSVMSKPIFFSSRSCFSPLAFAR